MTSRLQRDDVVDGKHVLDVVILDDVIRQGTGSDPQVATANARDNLEAAAGFVRDANALMDVRYELTFDPRPISSAYACCAYGTAVRYTTNHIPFDDPGSYK